MKIYEKNNFQDKNIFINAYTQLTILRVVHRFRINILELAICKKALWYNQPMYSHS